ncbi:MULTISPECIES: amino acid adenylation domain-containing protein [unclassified Bradyrhizobium]|uniref:non-ribosomal peptide synthetase n=1 Tax=unclassified Bradyrhizobium TaxID=2631580 RepID=UPI0028E1CDE0|nr:MULTISPECIES: amino acid adenylation domain-containing protein [unclassified Bradyrhizobium]
MFQLTGRLAERFEPFPLTELQEAYLVGRSSDLAIGNVGSHAYHEYEIPQIDVERFERAWLELVARHDALRMIFLPDGRQKVMSDVKIPKIAVHDLRELSPASVRASLQETRERMGAFIFEPQRWPLFAIEITRLDHDIAYVHLAIDLLIVDAWSMLIVRRDLVRAYLNPGCLAKDPLTITFRDYVVEGVEFKRTDGYRASKEYWDRRIEDFPLPPQLPIKVPSDPKWRPTFRRIFGRLSVEQWSTIKQRAAAMGVTPSTPLLTAFGKLLSTYSANQRFVINLTMYNRPAIHPDIGRVVGDFTSVVLLEMDFEKQMPFVAECMATQRQLWTDIENNAAGGIRVLRELSRRQRSPFIVPVVFTSTLGFELLSGDESSPNVGQYRYRAGQTPQVVLDHLLREENGSLRFAWNVVEEIFPDGLLTSMFNTYCAMLEEISSPDSVWSDRLECRVEPVQSSEPIAVAGTSDPGTRATLDGLFVDQAARTPHALAVMWPNGSLDYGSLERVSRAVADRLSKLTSTHGAPVGVLMKKGWEQVAAVLGVLRAGLAYLPLDPALPPQRIARLMQNGKVSALVIQPRLTDLASNLPAENIVPVVLEMSCDSQDLQSGEGLRSDDPLRLAYVIYTSGSTGEPKGVMVDHAAAVNTVLDINRRFDVKSEDRVLALSSLSFDLSVYDIFGVLAAGGAVVMPDDESLLDPAAWLSLARRAGVTVWNSAPALLKLFTQHCLENGATLDRMRLAMASGDWVPLELVQQCRKINPKMRFVSLGGATEAAIWSVFREVDEVGENWVSIPYGKPLTNQALYVFDRNLTRRPVWVPGEIYISGAGLAIGYLGDKSLTDTKFIVHPDTGERLYRTGDMGRYLPDGDIEFLGRQDQQVKLRGFRIELGEIEATLTAHDGVREAIVTLREDLPGDARLVAYVVMEEPAISSIELRRYLQQLLPEHMVPSIFVALDALPLTTNGKINRKALPAPETRREGESTYASPKSSLEVMLASAWADILKVDRVGVDDNFFDLGGNSLLLMQVQERVKKEIGQELPLMTLFRYPTISALAAEIAHYNEENRSSPTQGAVRAESRRRAVANRKRR